MSTEIQWNVLRHRATEMLSHAYAPYSHYPVGAAGVTSDGRVVAGCNVENVSYGLGICAEVSLVAQLISQGDRSLRAVTVTDASGIQRVDYQMKRVIGGSTEYFHASSSIGGIWNSDSSFERAAVVGNRWEVDGLLTTAYFDRNTTMTFTLTIRATDNAGNVASSSITFTLY